MKTTLPPIWSIFLSIVCFISACRNDPVTDNETPLSQAAPATEVPAESTPDAPEKPATTASPNWDYYHLAGTVSDMKVTMELTREESPYYPNGGYFKGFYRYERIGGPIQCYGSLNERGELVLNEDAGWRGEPNTFTGRWHEDGRFSGTWTSGDQKRSFPFQLGPADDQSVDFRLKSFADSVVAFPQWPRSPVAHFSADWLEAETPDPALNRFLQMEISRGLVGDSLAQAHSTLIGALQVIRDDYAKMYRDEMERFWEEGMIDTAATDGYMSYAYEQSSSVIIYCNSPNLLTLGFLDYYYMGGAHGMHGTGVRSYDLQRQVPLQLEDVFLPGYESTLIERLNYAARKKHGMQDNESLTEVFFVEEIEPTANFGLTEKGVFFVYSPYEIAPYAAGEIELYIPFADIRAIVQEQWLNND